MLTIIDKKTAAHYQWGDKCDSWILVETENLSVKQESMPPGTRERLHLHTDAQQLFFILNGTATFYLEDKRVTLKQLQSLLIKKKTKHLIANETSKTLEFLVISQPLTTNDRINVSQ